MPDWGLAPICLIVFSGLLALRLDKADGEV